jgi:hypothetical protein
VSSLSQLHKGLKEAEEAQLEAYVGKAGCGSWIIICPQTMPLCFLVQEGG